MLNKLHKLLQNQKVIILEYCIRSEFVIKCNVPWIIQNLDLENVLRS